MTEGAAFLRKIELGDLIQEVKAGLSDLDLSCDVAVTAE